MINIIYFASLRERLGISEEQIELPAQVNTVAELLTHLGKSRDESWLAALTADTTLIAVNQTMVKQDQSIVEGDEIAFFPPVTGG